MSTPVPDSGDAPVPGSRPLRIALLGSRGIPARYGGFETLMEELSLRLRQCGYDVTVYCRSHYTDRRRRQLGGVRLAVLPTIRTKHLDTPVHTLLSCFHAVGRRYDAALVVNAANALFLPLLTAAGIPTSLLVDGVEQRRAKWGVLGRVVYGLSERLACVFPKVLVTDAAVIRDRYRTRYGADSWLITYGADPRAPVETGLLERLGLETRRYFLYVSRFEQENNPHLLARAYRDVQGDLPLVMVGDAPYARRFIASFRQGADPRILFPGAIYGDGYRELMSHALAYVHATQVGGSHPALVEAMGHGNCVVVSDNPENSEVAGDCALFFRVGEPATLVAAIERVRQDPDRARALGEAAAARAARLYSWERVTREYVRLFEHLASRSSRP